MSSVRCPACDESLPAEARFCWRCGTPQATGPAPAEERRVVSILFCDLAGFTERSDRADPEDVRRILVPFHAAVRREIERFGGHLDKFIGDGALGVFGAPVAHEDDPLRAVEAGLAILREVERLARSQPGTLLRARGAVASGPAVVQLGSGPQVGEAVAGDVVNTASRLQSVAEPGSLVVDASVHPAVASRVEATPLGTITVKGKREPLEIWRVDGVRPVGAQPGRVADEPPFVGREGELARLRDAWEAIVTRAGSRIATVVGEAGIGKSRLVAEVATAAGGRWLRGRCHPYGEGVALAALAQILREGLGLRADAAADDVGRRVHDLAATIDTDPQEAAWLTARLLPSLGVEDESGAPPPRPEETVAAWGRAICAIAGTEPLALVIDDAQWADPPLLDLIRALPDAVDDARLLVVLVGRPEVLDRWTDDDAVHLSSLDPGAVIELLEATASGTLTELPPDRLASVVDAAAGNPLYAVEFGRLLAEHADPSTGIPTSVQALIAARLDALPSDERQAVSDASVIGRIFWGSALPAIGGGTDADTLGMVLDSLRRRGVIRREPDDDAYAFTQSLVREVAYGRLTRTQRLMGHRAAADWLAVRRDVAPESVDAEAHHRRMALELARTLDAPDIERIEADARTALRAAATRAWQLDLPRSVALAREALALMPDDDPELPAFLVTTTASARRAGMTTPAEAAREYERAVDAARRTGDRAIEAEALARAAMDLGFDGATDRGRRTLDEALVLLEDLPPSLTTVRAVLTRAEELDFAGRYDEVAPWLDRAEAILTTVPGSGVTSPHADDARLDPVAVELTSMLLHLRGDVRCVGGDLDGGIEDIRRTIDLARGVGSANAELQALSYLSEWSGMTEGPEAALSYQGRALTLCEKRGFARSAWWTRAERGWALADLERWDEVGTEATLILAAGEEVTGDATYAVAMWLRLRSLIVGDRLEEATAIADETLARARDVEQLQLLLPVFAAVAILYGRTGRAQEAVALVREAIDVTRDDARLHRMLVAHDLVRVSLAAGDRSLAEDVLDGLASDIPRAAACLATARALLAADAGDATSRDAWRDALAAWEPMGPTVERRFAAEALARSSTEEVASG